MFKHLTKNITIEARSNGKYQIAWALFIDGQYQKTKVLPKNNTAIPQNFGFALDDFIWSTL